MITDRTKKIFSLVALLMVLVLAFSMMQISVFADEEIPEGDVDVELLTDTADGAEVPSVTNDAGDTETAKATDTGSKTDTGADKKKEKTVDRNAIISWIIVGVVVIGGVALCFAKREKVLSFLASLKSESKKIVWTKREDVIKGSLVTLVVIIVCAAVIGLLDFAFTKGIIALGSLI